jgi:hypothetical protein
MNSDGVGFSFNLNADMRTISVDLKPDRSDM